MDPSSATASPLSRDLRHDPSGALVTKRTRRPPPALAHLARFSTKGEPWCHFSGLRYGVSRFALRWATVWT